MKALDGKKGLWPHGFVTGPGRGECRVHDWHQILTWHYEVVKGDPV